MLLTVTDAAGSLRGAGFASAAKRHFRRHRRKLAIAAALAVGARGMHHRQQMRHRVVDMGAPIGADWVGIPDSATKLKGRIEDTSNHVWDLGAAGGMMPKGQHYNPLLA